MPSKNPKVQEYIDMVCELLGEATQDLNEPEYLELLSLVEEKVQSDRIDLHPELADMARLINERRQKDPQVYHDAEAVLGDLRRTLREGGPTPAVETRALLASAYKGGRRDLKALLTHAYRAGAPTTLCGRISEEHLADVLSMDANLPPTCPACLKKDPRQAQ